MRVEMVDWIGGLGRSGLFFEILAGKVSGSDHRTRFIFSGVSQKKKKRKYIRAGL
jgi:hypothetical protein